MKLRCLLLLLLTSLTACSSQPTQKVSSRPLKLAVNRGPITLDPRQVEDRPTMVVLQMIYDGLMRIDPSGEVAPAIAESVSISEDKKKYTFYLRQTAWDNGDLLVAEDIAYSWLSQLDPLFPSKEVHLLYPIRNAQKAKSGEVGLDQVGIRVIDERTLEVELENPVPYFLELTTQTPYFPVPKHLAEADPDWGSSAETLVTNGPFSVKFWKPFDGAELERNRSYWDDKHVFLPGVSISCVEQDNTVFWMYEQGEIDWAGAPMSTLPADALPFLKQEKQLQTILSASTYWLNFNTEKCPFSNIKVRQALSLGLRRKELVQHITQAGEVATMRLVPEMIGGRPPQCDGELSVTEARRLLVEGLEECEMTLSDMHHLVLSYNNTDNNHKIIQAIQQQWRDVFGIRPEIEACEWGVYLNRLSEGDYQVARLARISQFSDPMTMLELFEDKDGPNNRPRWENHRYKNLIEKARRTSDWRERSKLMAEAEDILVEETPIAPLFLRTEAYVCDPELEGVIFRAVGIADYKSARWKNET